MSASQSQEVSFASVADIPVHILMDQWNVFIRYLDEDKPKSSQYCPKSARMLSTVEDVWCYLFELQPVYRENYKSHNNFMEISMFRQGIEPGWEDPKNKNGSEYRYETPLSSDESSFDTFRDGVCFYFFFPISD